MKRRKNGEQQEITFITHTQTNKQNTASGPPSPSLTATCPASLPKSAPIRAAESRLRPSEAPLPTDAHCTRPALSAPARTLTNALALSHTRALALPLSLAALTRARHSLGRARRGARARASVARPFLGPPASLPPSPPVVPAPDCPSLPRSSPPPTVLPYSLSPPPPLSLILLPPLLSLFHILSASSFLIPLI